MAKICPAAAFAIDNFCVYSYFVVSFEIIQEMPHYLSFLPLRRQMWLRLFVAVVIDVINNWKYKQPIKNSSTLELRHTSQEYNKKIKIIVNKLK